MILSATRPRLEVADILRIHGDAYRQQYPISREQAAVMRHLTTCRTAVLGGHVDSCRQCGFVRVSYNSCRDRHCPKCQATRQAAWLQERLKRLLPVDYFHVVFTLPAELKPLTLKNRRLMYRLLFQAASATLLELSADPKRLGGQIGVTAVLHTWGQNLLFHPHLHCVVTSGGLSPDGQRWVAFRNGYFLPVKVLGKLFRGKFLAALNEAYQKGELRLTGSVAELSQSQHFDQLLKRLYKRAWIVYAKRPFCGPEHVFRYLARYTHRVAISNNRLLSHTDGKVRFRYKDYADGSKKKVMTVSAMEFIRRFLLHVLPKGFVRIRHYGLLASRNASTKLEHCRDLLGVHKDIVEPTTPPESEAELSSLILKDIHVCPQCHSELSRTEFERDTLTSFTSPHQAVQILDSS